MSVLGQGIAFLLVLLVSASSWSQSTAVYPSLDKPAKVEKSRSKDVAVIVTIEDYAFLPPVRGAVANGNDWEAFFRRDLGVGTVHVVANKAATDDEMRRFAALAAKDVGKGGTLWFVFIGHGAPDAQRADGILVGMDAQQTTTSLVSRGVAQQEILEILGKGKQNQTVLIVDACFSGRDTSGNALVEAQPVMAVNFQPKIEENTTVILSAAHAREFAGPLPGDSRPAFSYLLLGALRGWAENGKGQVSANDALWFTQKVLRGLPGRFDQTPSLHGNGNLVLVRGVGEKDPGVRSLIEQNLRQPVAKETTSISTLSDDTAMGRTSLGELDIEQLRQLEAVSQAIRDAQALDADTEATVTARAEAWERAAVLPVKGGNPYATEAHGRAAHWREVAASVTRMRSEWTTLEEVLGMQVVSWPEKQAKVDKFLAEYGALGDEPELVVAREVLAILEQEAQSSATPGKGLASKPELGSPMTYDDERVTFKYPGNWKLREVHSETYEGIRTDGILVESSGSAIASIIVFYGVTNHDVLEFMTADVFSLVQESARAEELEKIMGAASSLSKVSATKVSREPSRSKATEEEQLVHNFSLTVLGESSPHRAEIHRFVGEGSLVITYFQVADEERAVLDPGFALIYDTIRAK